MYAYPIEFQRAAPNQTGFNGPHWTGSALGPGIEISLRDPQAEFESR
jgi:hypothetical protein